MSIRFSGGDRFQRGRGIGGILRAAKSLFQPIIGTIGRAVKSNTGKAIGNAIKEQVIESGVNLAADALRGNDLSVELNREANSFKKRGAEGLEQLQQSRRKKELGQDVKDAIQVLKHIKSLKGDYNGYVEHANSKDIHIISNCCYNLLEDNIPLPLNEKKKIKIFLTPIKKEINIISNKKASVKTKREILSDPQFGEGIFTLLASTILPALISAFAK